MLVNQNNGVNSMSVIDLGTQGRHAVLNGRLSKRKVYSVVQ